MAERLLICRPEAIAANQVSHAGLERLLTPEPKEAYLFAADGGSRYLSVDLGAERTIDLLYLGYHNVTGPGPIWSVSKRAAFGAGAVTPLFEYASLVPSGDAEPRQSAVRLADPVAARFLDIAINPGGVAFHAGVFAAGPSLAPVRGHEWDSGRLIEDTGSVERRLDGGFGIDEGVAAGGYEWSFDSLQPAEVSTLYRWAKERRTTRSILVAEAGGGPGEFPSECLHWGLFDRFERFSRRDPDNTRWALRVRDWA